MLVWLFNESPVGDVIVTNDRFGGMRGLHGPVYSSEYGGGKDNIGYPPWRSMGLQAVRLEPAKRPRHFHDALEQMTSVTHDRFGRPFAIGPADRSCILKARGRGFFRGDSGRARRPVRELVPWSLFLVTAKGF